MSLCIGLLFAYERWRDGWMERWRDGEMDGREMTDDLIYSDMAEKRQQCGQRREKRRGEDVCVYV